MALVITEATPELLDTTNATSYSMAAFVPTANSLIVVPVWATATAASLGGISANAPGTFTWTKLLFGDITDTGVVLSYFLWIGQVGASPVSSVIEFTCTGDTASSCQMVAWQVTGHNAASPYAQVKHLRTSGADPIITLDQAMNTLNGYCAGVFIGRTAPLSTPPASWTEICDGGILNPAIGITAAHRVNGETGSTVQFVLLTNADIHMLFIEINEASQGAAVTPKRMMLMGVG